METSPVLDAGLDGESVLTQVGAAAKGEGVLIASPEGGSFSLMSVRLWATAPPVLKQHSSRRPRPARWPDGTSTFIGVVPGRILSATVSAGDDYVDSQDGDEWNTRVTLEVKALPSVPAAIVIVEALNQEYGTNDGTFSLENVRLAMKRYVAEALESRRVLGYGGQLWTVSLHEGPAASSLSSPAKKRAK